MVDQIAEESLPVAEPESNQVEDHIALIYERDEERLTTITPLIKVGLEKGELCLYVSDEENDTAIVEALKAEHVDVDKAVSNGSLILTSKKEVYFKLGRFDPEWTIRVINNIADLARSYGFTAMRVMSEMTWTQEKFPGVERWPEYEAKINSLNPGISIRVICQYDRRRFAPEALMAAIQTHPRIVAEGEIINKNSFYIPADRLLHGNYAEAELERVLSSIRHINSSEAALQERERALEAMGRKADAESAARKGLEKALEESRRRFKDLAERASDWAWELDEKGVYVYSSPRVKDLLGLQPEDVIGKTPLDLVSKEAAERTSKLLAGAMSSHAPFSALEIEACHRDGHTVYLEMSGTPHFDHEGNFTGYRGVDRDISGRKAAKQAIEESRRRMEESLAEIKARDERIAALDGEIARLKGSLSELDASIAVLRGDIDGKEAQLKEAVEGLSRLKESLQSREEELTALRAAQEEKQSKLEAQAEEIAGLRKQLEDKGGELTGVQAALAAAQLMLKGKATELEELTSSFNAQSLELKGARESLSGVEETLAHKEQEQFAMRQQIERLEADLLATRDSLAARDAELSKAQQELSEVKAALEQRSSELAAANEMLAQRVNELNAANELAEQRAQEITAAKETIEARTAELAAANSSLEQRIAELALAREAVEKRDAELAAANELVEGTKAELEATKGNLESTISELETARQKIGQREEELKVANETIEAKAAEVVALTGSLELRASELKAASELAEQRAAELQAARERLDQLAGELSAANGLVESRNAELEALKASLERTSSELAAATGLAEQRAVELAAANELAEQRAGEVTAAEARIAEKEASLAEALMIVESLKASLSSRENDLEARTAERDARIEEIARLTEEKTALESALAAKGAELAAAIASSEGLKADVAALTEELQLAKESCERYEKERQELMSAVSARDSALADLRSEADKVAADLAARDADLAAVRATLAERERELAQTASRADMLSKVLVLKEEELAASLRVSEARRNEVERLSFTARQLEADQNVSVTVIEGLKAALQGSRHSLAMAIAENLSAEERASAMAEEKETLAAKRMSETAALREKVRELEAARDAASGEAGMMRMAFLGLPYPAALVSPDGRILTANAALEQLTSSGLEGRSIVDLWPEIDISEPGTVKATVNGEDMEMRFTPSALKDGTRDIGTVLAFTEPTPVKKAPAGPSPEVIAHDLNDSLQVIMGSVSLAKEYVIPEGRMYSKLKQIESASATARELASKLMSPAREVHLPVPATPSNLTRGKGRLLLLDDDENVLEATGDLLRYLGYTVEVARDGEEAVAMCKEAEEIWQSYDLAIVDLSITSGMGGIEASKRMVAMNPNIKLIVTSGYIADPVIADPASHGFAAALSKPYSAELLSKTIAEVLAKRSA